MKQCYLFIFILGILMPGRAQEYHPFDTVNISWTEREELGEPPETTYHNYYVEGDTVIDNQKFFKIYEDKDSVVSYMGAFREENRVVYYRGMDYWMFEPDSTVVLYDFTKDVGDTVVTGYGMEQVIEAVDSVLVDGDYRKRYTTDWGHQWIEGIGSMAGFFYPISEIPIEYWRVWMSCFKKNGEVIYLNPSFTDCTSMVGFAEQQNVHKVSFYPNPVRAGQNVIITCSGRLQGLQVIDASGSIVAQQMSINQHKVNINTEGLQAGLYIVRVNLKSRMVTKRIIVTN